MARQSALAVARRPTVSSTGSQSLGRDLLDAAHQVSDDTTTDMVRFVASEDFRFPRHRYAQC
jgi:hypothetical protein